MEQLIRTQDCPLSEKIDNATGIISFPHSTDFIEYFPYARDQVSHWEFIWEQNMISGLKEPA